MTRPKGSAEELAKRIDKARAEQPIGIDEAVEEIKKWIGWGVSEGDNGETTIDAHAKHKVISILTRLQPDTKAVLEKLQAKMIEFTARTDLNPDGAIGCKCNQSGKCVYCLRVIATNEVFIKAIKEGGRCYKN